MFILEIWKPIKEFEGIYEVSNTGKIRSLTRKVKMGRGYRIFEATILKPQIDKDGYFKVNLSKNGKKKRFFVHRLVAEAFIENPNNFPVVNHKDGNKQNNHVDNLEWTTISENTKHAFRINLRKPHCGGTSKKVAKVDPSSNKIIEIYGSIKDAARKNNISDSCISDCAKGRLKTSRKFKWVFISEGVTTNETTSLDGRE